MLELLIKPKPPGHSHSTECELSHALVVTGATTSGCVRATAVEALSYGFRAIVPIETCADKHESYHFANLTDLQIKYADVEPVQAVIDWLEAR